MRAQIDAIKFCGHLSSAHPAPANESLTVPKGLVATRGGVLLSAPGSQQWVNI